jgi:NADH dehydrogenase
LSPGDIASPIRWVLRRQKNVTVLLANVRDVDVAGRRVLLDEGGAVSYDFLIVATGPRTRISDMANGSRALRA